MPQPCLLIRPLRFLCHEIQFAQLILLFHCLYLLSSERKQNHLSIAKERLCFVLHMIFICFIEDNLKEVPGFLCLQRSSHSHTSMHKLGALSKRKDSPSQVICTSELENGCVYIVCLHFFTALQCNKSRC